MPINYVQIQIAEIKADLARAKQALAEHYANWDSPEWYVGHNYNHYGFDYYTRLYEQDIEELEDSLYYWTEQLYKTA